MTSQSKKPNILKVDDDETRTHRLSNKGHHQSLLLLTGFCSAWLIVNCKVHKHSMSEIKWIKEITCHSQRASVRITQSQSDLYRSILNQCSQNLIYKHLDTSVVKNIFCWALAASNSWLIQKYCIYWFAKALARIYWYSDSSNYTNSVKENILFLFSSVKIEGEMILNDKKSWTFFLVYI